MKPCVVCGGCSARGARFCSSCGAALGSELLAQRKIATVLFCDVVGFTAAVERADAESQWQIMLGYFEEARSAIERHGGTVEKFIGDAVVGVFGVPVAQEDAALRAVRAAVDIDRQVAALNPELERRYGAGIQLRIGVNTGEVVAGRDPVSGGSMVIADAVNVAARLQQAADPGEIVLGDQTHHLLREQVVAEPLAPIEAKGKSQPLRGYRLRRLVPDSPRSAAGHPTPLVGRVAELEALTAALRAAVAERRCRMVTVIGDPGVGKSRLAEELCARYEGEATFAWGATPSYGDGVTYLALGQALRQAAGISEGDAPERALARLGAVAGAGRGAARAVDAVGQALGLCAGTATVDEIGVAVRILLEAIARTSPLVMVFDDIHLAEPAFLDLLERLDGRGAGPILLVCAARRDLLEHRPDWPATIRLGPLDDRDSSQLLHGLIGPGRGAMERRIAAAAEGNPLFLEQLVAMLGEEGALDRENGSPAPAADVDRIRLPVGLAMLLTARLDRLPETARMLIERASIEGVTFHVGASSALLGIERAAAIPHALEALVAGQFVEPAASLIGGETALRFRHVLLREAAYASVSKRLRARLHEEYATWLRARVGGRELEYEEILGYHLEQAVILNMELGPLDEAGRRLGARAGALLGGAGQRALGRGDVDAAAQLLKRALDVLPADAAPRLELTYALGAARAELGDLAGAERLLAEAAAGIDSWFLAARARLELAWVRCMLDPRVGMSELRRIATEITGSSAAAGDDALLARAFHLSAVDLFGDEQHGRAVAGFERALTHARRAGDGRIEADALYLCGCATYFGPVPAGEVIPRWEALLGDSAHRPAVEAAAATGLALLSALRERFDEGRRLVGRTFEIYDELGMAVHRAGNMYTLVEIELLAGDLDAAEAAARSGHERFLSLGDQSFAAGGALYLAEIAEARGSFATAESLTATAEQLAGDDDTQTRARAGPLRARGLARGGRFDEALRLIGKTMAVLGESETPCRLGDALLDRAYVLRLAGRPGDADDAVRRAHELFERKGNRPRTRRAQGLLADAERAAAAGRQSG